MNHTPRTQNTVNANQRDRIRQLERKAGRDARPQTEERVIFSYIDPQQVQRSGVKRLRTGGQLVAVIWEADDVGDNDHIFDILADGAALGPGVTVPDTTISDTVYLGDFRVPAGTRVQLDTTQVGNHPGATVELIFKG